MPVMSCTENNKPGYKFGRSGRCYTYAPGNEEARKRARRRATQQGRAIKWSQRH